MKIVKFVQSERRAGSFQAARLSIEAQGPIQIDGLRLFAHLGEVPACARTVVPDADSGAVGRLRAAVSLARGIEPAARPARARARG